MVNGELSMVNIFLPKLHFQILSRLTTHIFCCTDKASLVSTTHDKILPAGDENLQADHPRQRAYLPGSL
jgi:hypothetical protein